jgi:hypothetical protein
MAIVMIFGGPDLTEAQYDQIHREVAPDDRPAPGLLYHAAGPGDDGFYIVEVWESQDAVDRFVQETLSGVLARAGIPAGPPRIVFPVRTSMQA